MARKRAGNRLLLGRSDWGDLLAVEGTQHVAVLGPTGSLKTTGLMIPALLESHCPVIATSVKGDLLHDTIGYRRRLGRVLVYDPMGTSGYPSTTWSPVHGSGSWQGAMDTAWWLVRAASAREQSPTDKFFDEQAANVLAVLLHAAALTGENMDAVLRWIRLEAEPGASEDVFACLRSGMSSDAVEEFTGIRAKEPRQRQSIYGTARGVVRAYAFPSVAATARGCEITAEAVLEGNSTLYLVAPSDDQEQFRPLFEALTMELLRDIRRGLARGGRLDPPLRMLWDEAGNVAPLRQFPQLVATGAGQGIQVVSVWQDMSQMRSLYGHDGAQTLWNNSRAKLVLSGQSDLHTCDQVSRLMGDEEIAERSTTRGSTGTRSDTDSITLRRLLAPDGVRRIPEGRGVLIYGHLPPTWLRLRVWHREHALRELVERYSEPAEPSP